MRSADVRAMKEHCANVFLRAFPGFLMDVARYFSGRHPLEYLPRVRRANGCRREEGVLAEPVVENHRRMSLQRDH